MTPKFRGLKQQTLSLIVPVRQESGHNLVECLWFKVSHEFVIKLLSRAPVTSGSTEAEGSASKLT